VPARGHSGSGCGGREGGARDPRVVNGVHTWRSPNDRPGVESEIPESRMKIRRKVKGRRDLVRSRTRLPPEAERKLVAIHEAAHAVVAHALGLEVDRITLDETEAGKVRADLAAFTAREFGTWRENSLVAIVGRLMDLRMEEQLGISLKFDVSVTDRHNDEELFKRSLYEEAGRDVAGGKALVSERMQEADALLLDRLELVNALADALAQRGALDAAEIVAILGPYPTVSADTLAARAAAESDRAEREAVESEAAFLPVPHAPEFGRAPGRSPHVFGRACTLSTRYPGGATLTSSSVEGRPHCGHLIGGIGVSLSPGRILLARIILRPCQSQCGHVHARLIRVCPDRSPRNSVSSAGGGFMSISTSG
jgi:hypothetical protein